MACLGLHVWRNWGNTVIPDHDIFLGTAVTLLPFLSRRMSSPVRFYVYHGSWILLRGWLICLKADGMRPSSNAGPVF